MAVVGVSVVTYLFFITILTQPQQHIQQQAMPVRNSLINSLPFIIIHIRPALQQHMHQRSGLIPLCDRIRQLRIHHIPFKPHCKQRCKQERLHGEVLYLGRSRKRVLQHTLADLLLIRQQQIQHIRNPILRRSHNRSAVIGLGIGGALFYQHLRQPEVAIRRRSRQRSRDARLGGAGIDQQPTDVEPGRLVGLLQGAREDLVNDQRIEPDTAQQQLDHISQVAVDGEGYRLAARIARSGSEHVQHRHVGRVLLDARHEGAVDHRGERARVDEFLDKREPVHWVGNSHCVRQSSGQRCRRWGLGDEELEDGRVRVGYGVAERRGVVEVDQGAVAEEHLDDVEDVGVVVAELLLHCVLDVEVERLSERAFWLVVLDQGVEFAGFGLVEGEGAEFGYQAGDVFWGRVAVAEEHVEDFGVGVAESWRVC